VLGEDGGGLEVLASDYYGYLEGGLLLKSCYGVCELLSLGGAFEVVFLLSLSEQLEINENNLDLDKTSRAISHPSCVCRIGSSGDVILQKYRAIVDLLDIHLAHY
jgi:hypothetical protein